MKIEQQYYNILWHKQPKDILLAIEHGGWLNPTRC